MLVVYQGSAEDIWQRWKSFKEAGIKQEYVFEDHMLKQYRRGTYSKWPYPLDYRPQYISLIFRLGDSNSKQLRIAIPGDELGLTRFYSFLLYFDTYLAFYCLKLTCSVVDLREFERGRKQSIIFTTRKGVAVNYISLQQFIRRIEFKSQ